MSIIEIKEKIAVSIMWEPATLEELVARLKVDEYLCSILLRSLESKRRVRVLKTDIIKITSEGKKWLKSIGFDIPEKEYKSEFRKAFEKSIGF